MSKIFRAWGYSDDNFAYSLGSVDDEVSCYGEAPFVRLGSSDGMLEVFGFYGPPDGNWGVGIRQAAEEHPLPSWPVEFMNTKDCPYSAMLVMQVPDDTEVIDKGSTEVKP